MGFIELILLAVGLAMDAFAVSVCKGLSVRSAKPAHVLTCGLWFGAFQAAMPVAGYLFGGLLSAYVESIGHWIAFVLLALIGLHMIKESLGAEDDAPDARFGPAAMLPLAVATSIDALAVGVSLSMIEASIVPAASIIGVVTFALSCIGVKVGNLFGAPYRSRAELIGGIILILIGLRILLEHLGIFAL